ncbi:MAG: hypothetical protein ACLPVY_25860 [Acidimicrobiia bacterium]
MAADYLTFVSGRSVSPLRARNTAGVNWLFRNRRTGEITVFQRPNVALGIFLAASIASLLFDPSGRSGTVLRLIARGALGFWAADELLRGVNPFRRALGAVFVVWVLSSLTF